MRGYKVIWTWRLSHRVPCCLDTEISPPYPESWCAGVYKQTFPKVLKSMPGCEILEQNIQIDHIHLLMLIPPKYAVSDVIGQIKQYTASRLREKFAWLGKVYWKEQIVWSPGYFVSTVGLDEKQISEYVKWQGHQDSGQAKLDL